MPDDIAVRHADGRLTYRELVSDSLDLARHLRCLGTARDSRVVVLVDSSLDLAVGVWGVLLAGSAYLPLSPDYPDERLRYMLEDAGVTVAFCQEPLRSRLEDLAPPHTVVTTPENVAEYRRENSDEQLSHEGMKEDTVHRKGPAELVREGLAALLPESMLPNRILVMDRLPHTANGKIDHRALEAHADRTANLGGRRVVPPCTKSESRICDLWKAAMKRDVVSVQDAFFACGGNPLVAVALVHRINRTFGSSLPLQVIFEAPTV